MFNDFSHIHHCDVITHLADDAEVMCNYDYCHLILILEFPHEVQDLRLYGDVQGGCGFICNEERRVA